MEKTPETIDNKIEPVARSGEDDSIVEETKNVFTSDEYALYVLTEPGFLSF